MKEFFTRVSIIDSEYHCMQKLFETMFVICVIPSIGAEELIRGFHNFEGNPLSRKTGISFDHQYSAFPYESSSPFAEKFDEIIQSIKEADLTRFYDFTPKIKKNFLPGIGVQNPPLEVLILVLFVGYFTAALVLFYELFYLYYVKFIDVLFN